MYFDYKIHILITLQVFITHFEIIPASINDREALCYLRNVYSNKVLLANKGYMSQ